MAIVVPVVGDDSVRTYEPQRHGFNTKVYKLITAPVSEPVDLTAAKLFFRVDGNDEDALITALLKAARSACENYTKSSFMPQTWELTQDAFTDHETASEESGFHMGATPRVCAYERTIHVARGPVASITSVVSYNSDNAASTVAASNYSLSGDSIVLKDSASWPTALREHAGVKLTYVAGYADAASVPEDIKTAILMHMQSLYDNRGCAEMSEGVKALLSPYQKLECFGGW